MIIVKMNGGLGNQMFQYAFGRALQLKYKDSFFLDVEEFRRTYGHVPRHYSLETLSVTPEMSILPIKDSSSLLIFKVLHKINRNWTTWFAKCFNVYWWRSPVYKDFGIKDTKGKKCYFYGYWQSEKYFADYKDIIKQELKVKTPITEECLPYAEQIENSNAVCLHIRRGDFVKEGQIICDVAFYEKGIQYIDQRVKDARYFIFTNDEKWVKENIHLPKDSTFVDIADPDYEVLRLMYMCKHFVISNSSYSWWGQYLSDNPHKIVIAPSKWSLVWPNERSIYMDNWITM